MLRERDPGYSYLNVNNDDYRRKWELSVMAGALLALKELHKPINPQYLQFNHNLLRQAIYRISGGWRAVVEFAGLDPDLEYSELYRERNRFLR